MVFCFSHIVVRKNVQSLYIVERSNESAKLVQILLVVRQARNDHVADPDRDGQALQITGESQDIIPRLLSDGQMLLRIYVLNVQHNQVCYGQETFKAGKESWVVRAEGNSGSIKTGMDTATVSLLKKFCHKL